MMRRVVICGAAIGCMVVSGCGSQPARTAAPPTSQASAGPLLLAQFTRGVGAVPADSNIPVWTDPAAVAALDGSAVLSVRATASSTSTSSGAAAEELVRLDPDTGAVIASWPLKSGALSISAVSPAGHWVALTDRQPGYGAPQGRRATELVVFDIASGTETHRLELTGDQQPRSVLR